MGATVGCAQCHDHKYDPYTIKDHYTLAAFFADVYDSGYNGNTLPTNRPPEMLFHSDANEARIEALKKQVDELLDETTVEELRKLEAGKASLTAKLKVGKDEKAKDEAKKEIAGIEKRITELIPADVRKKWDQLELERRMIHKEGRLTMITEAKPPREMRILPRGNWQDDSGEVVSPAIPEFLGTISIPENSRPASTWPTGSPTRVKVQGSNGSRFCQPLLVSFLRHRHLTFSRRLWRSGRAACNAELLDKLAVSFYETTGMLKP